jgi:hypothetical protein
MITGKLYDWLKWLAQIVFPALGHPLRRFGGLVGTSRRRKPWREPSWPSTPSWV